MSDEEAEGYIAKELRKISPFFRKDQQGLLNEIRRVREDGFCSRTHLLKRENRERRYTAVAISLSGNGMTSPMVLGVCDVEENFSGREDKLVNLMRGAVNIYWLRPMIFRHTNMVPVIRRNMEVSFLSVGGS